MTLPAILVVAGIFIMIFLSFWGGIACIAFGAILYSSERTR